MRLNPKIQDALQAIETARAEFVAVLREIAQQAGKAPAPQKRSRARRATKAVAKKNPA
jgi:predicted translin family RNA/ssDNA-binding protein